MSRIFGMGNLSSSNKEFNGLGSRQGLFNVHLPSRSFFGANVKGLLNIVLTGAMTMIPSSFHFCTALSTKGSRVLAIVYCLLQVNFPAGVGKVTIDSGIVQKELVGIS